jgi:DNA-binding GntR family transcriptional regulator
MSIERDIAADLAARIIRGEWKSGDKLPVTRDFAREYDVSQSTMYHVFKRLIERGLVRGERGGRRYVV